MPRVYRYRIGRFEPAEVAVVAERPLTVVVNGQELATLLCTPTELEALVLGFLRFEGFLEGPDEVEELEIDPDGGLARVRLSHEIVPPPRKIFTSGCTGGVTFSLDLAPPLGPADAIELPTGRIFPLLRELFQRAVLYRESRGIHAAGLAGVERVLLTAEDVGRHNAVDKIQGLALLSGIRTRGKILLSTGRISSEMMRKGARMGVPVIISRTSPTHLAIEGAQRLGLTLIGYARPDAFTVYSHPERLATAPPTGRAEVSLSARHEEA